VLLRAIARFGISLSKLAEFWSAADFYEKPSGMVQVATGQRPSRASELWKTWSVLRAG
jgi:hypothetical protein